MFSIQHVFNTPCFQYSTYALVQHSVSGPTQALILPEKPISAHISTCCSISRHCIVAPHIQRQLTCSHKYLLTALTCLLYLGVQGSSAACHLYLFNAEPRMRLHHIVGQHSRPKCALLVCHASKRSLLACYPSILFIMEFLNFDVHPQRPAQPDQVGSCKGTRKGRNPMWARVRLRIMMALQQ